jgi:cytochrome c oxidase assembly protein subunit 15
LSDTSSVPRGQTAALPGAALAVFRLAAGFTFLAVAMGSVVCATGSGAGCPTWPGCGPDALTPQWRLEPVIEFTHRVVAVGAGPLVLAAALTAMRLHFVDRWVRILPWFALAGALAAGAFGRLVVLSGMPSWVGAVDLVSALTSMITIGVAASRLAPRQVPPLVSRDPRARSVRVSRWHAVQVSQLAAASVVVLIALHTTGLFAAGVGSFTRCLGWPLWRIVDTDRYPWLQGLRLGMAVLATALVAGTAAAAVRQAGLRLWGIGIGALLAAELLIGSSIRGGGFGIVMAAVYSLVACTLLWGLGLLAAVARVRRLTPYGASQEPNTLRSAG